MMFRLWKFSQTKVVRPENSLTAFITACKQTMQLISIEQIFTFLSFTVVKLKEVLFGIGWQFLNNRLQMSDL